jgi:aldose 1-epimerase
MRCVESGLSPRTYTALVRVRTLSGITICLCWALSALAQYSVKADGDVVQLGDAKHQTTVSIVISVGNEAFEMKVKGQNVLFFPYASLDEFKSRPTLSGIPFLGPWANRLDEQAFYANGKRYVFNMGLGNVRGAHPIHGFLATTDKWEMIEATADEDSAHVTSRLEFYRQPQWMAQFPFAHTIEMTYRLRDGVLEVMTKVQNLSTEPMPLSIGFHPYYQLTDSSRDEWVVDIGAKSQWVLNADKIPTGETVPIEKVFSDPTAVPLRDHNLDDVFGDLIRDASGRASVSVQGKTQKLEIVLGSKYRALVIFAPGGQPPGNGAGTTGAPGPTGTNRRRMDGNFIALEPMVGITDAMNLAQKGLYKELQSIAPGETWQESFWVRPSGF